MDKHPDHKQERAKVTIVIEDAEDGTVDFHMESDPPFPGPASGESGTAAQGYAARFFALIADDVQESR